MGNYHFKSIKVANLLVNSENSRFEEAAENQRETILTMIEDQKEKLFNLAKDILDAGLNPSDLPIVIPEETIPNRYIVLEGNRRVIAIKILLEPALIPEKNKLFKRFKKLSLNIHQTRFDEIYCVVFENEDDADRWIELKHTGENEGVGTAAWDGAQKERFRQRRGKTSISLQVIEFVKKKGNYDEEVKKKIDSLPITNLKRLIADPDVRKELGINYKQGKLETNLPEDEVFKGLQKVVLDVADQKINVNDIRKKEDRANYIKTFENDELPNMSVLNKTWTLDSIKENKTKSILKRSKPVSTMRKYLIPSTCIMQIPDNRNNSIYKELRKLIVDDFPNSVAILSRVFLELSVDYYIDNYKPSNITINDHLKDKIKKVINELKTAGVLNNKEAQALLSTIASPDELFSTPTLNAYVHNRNIQPKASDLKITWDNMELLMKNIWK